MPNDKLIPCLWFDREAESAAAFYTRVFPGGRIVGVSHYPDALDNPGHMPRGSVLTVEFEVAGQRFTALNGGPMFLINPSISFFVFVDTHAEARRLYDALAEGGAPLMALGAYPWSDCYGWVKDRFGVSWQVMALRHPQGDDVIVPCLMFAGAQHGRAEEALRFYAGAFPGGGVESVKYYEPGEGPEGTVKHGRALVKGHALIAMDSHVSHDVAFSEALSLQVMCRDQAEVDRCWAVLSEGGEQGPCGWLKDRFGVSWQVVPERIYEMMLSPDAAARDRAFAAMLKMGKLDIAALDEAFAGSA
jgi:predicted 3-demethylubiquinone-9 3-methyltransferase (glyoxalase superfamily)